MYIERPKTDRKLVRLGFLKEVVIKQAEEKGFGTKLEEVNVPEKILCIASELCEANLPVKKQRERLVNNFNYLTRDDPYGTGEKDHFSWLAMMVVPNSPDLYMIQSPERANYEEEWGDVLQRILHLGGIFSITFPESYTMLKGNIPTVSEIEDRTAEFLDMVIQSHTHYRHKQIELFKSDLIWLAEYCCAVALEDGFDIEKAVLEKIENNKSRIWDPTKLNETLRVT
jgi:hypothetical protein